MDCLTSSPWKVKRLSVFILRTARRLSQEARNVAALVKYGILSPDQDASLRKRPPNLISWVTPLYTGSLLEAERESARKLIFKLFLRGGFTLDTSVADTDGNE